VQRSETGGGGVKRLIEDGRVIEGPEVLEKLTQAYLSKVGTPHRPTSTLNEFLHKYEIELPTLDDNEISYLEQPFSIDEVKNALQAAKQRSAPGPSGQGISIFKYIFKMVPYILVCALNELTFVPGLINDSAFAWLLHRHIIYIPKPGKDPDRVSNLRPLSMLETLYKIQTKILTDRMSGALETLLYLDQHGFQKNKSIQTATFPVLEAMMDAEKHNKSLQYVSIDIQSAFDSISPECIFQIMLKEQYPNIFVEAMSNLTAQGTFGVSLNGKQGDTHIIRCGSGQGNPPSAGNFNLGTDPLLRALNKRLQLIQYKFENQMTLPTLAYADDHLHGLHITNSIQINQLVEIYTDYQKISGLKISPQKTVILGINTPPQLLEEIRAITGMEVVNSFRYLGLQVGGSYRQTIEDSYEHAHSQQTKKYNKINSAHLDLIHKKQLITSVILPSYNHIFMSVGYNEEWGKRIDNEVIQILWTQKEGDLLRQKRRLVARRRVNASYEYGGLQITFSEQVSKSLLVNTLKRVKMQLGLPNDTKLLMTKIIESEVYRCMGISLSEMFRMSGPQVWKLLGNRTYSYMIKQMSLAMASMLQLQENDRDTWLAMPILGHTLCPALFRLTIADGILLTGSGYTHVAQLFGLNELTGKIDKRAASPMNNVEANIRTKCMALRARLSNLDLSIDYMPGESILRTLDRVRWSSTFRKLHRNSVNRTFPGPPSYFTRQADRIPVPPLSQYMNGYRKLFHLKLHSKTIENSYNILNRTLWTNMKQHLSSREGGDEHSADCYLCGRSENTTHLIFECEQYSEKVWKNLGDTLSSIEDTPITIHAFNVLYNTNLRNLTNIKNEQVLYLIQEIKRNIVLRRFLRETTGPGIINYNRIKIMAHLLIVVKKCIYQRKNEGYIYEFLLNIQNYIEEHI
jgi:hypothetical protein